MHPRLLKPAAVKPAAAVRAALAAAPLVLAALALPGASRAESAPAADAARGARIAYTCLGCHGIPDYRNAYPNYHVPKIGGQHEAYLVAALGEYRAGARRHPTMKGQAASMSAQDIRDVAAYFAAPAPPRSGGPPTGTAPEAVAVCAACHGADGVGVLPEYPTLSGQHRDYLETTLRAYRSGTRVNVIMQGMAAALKDEDVQALAAWFSQQAPVLRTLKAPRAAGAP